MVVKSKGNFPLKKSPKQFTGWWFQRFFFSSLRGEMVEFDSYFSDELKPPTSSGLGIMY